MSFKVKDFEKILDELEMKYRKQVVDGKEMKGTAFYIKINVNQKKYTVSMMIEYITSNLYIMASNIEEIEEVSEEYYQKINQINNGIFYGCLLLLKDKDSNKKKLTYRLAVAIDEEVKVTIGQVSRYINEINNTISRIQEANTDDKQII